MISIGIGINRQRQGGLYTDPHAALGLPLGMALDFGRGQFCLADRRLRDPQTLIDNATPGARTYIDSTGKLQTAAAGVTRVADYSGIRERTNLLSNSAVSLAAGWVVSGATGTDLNLNTYLGFNGTRVVSNGAIWHRANHSAVVAVTSGETYPIRLYLKFGTSGKVMPTFRKSDGSVENRFLIDTSGTISLLSGDFGDITLAAVGVDDVYLLDAVFTPSYTGDLGIGFGPGSAVVGEDVILLGAQFETGTTPSAYIPTSGAPVTVYEPQRAGLFEASATNRILYSTDPRQQPWSVLDASVSDVPVAAPDMSLTASRITFDGGDSRIEQQHIGSSYPYTVSVWVRSNSGPVDALFSLTGGDQNYITVTDEWRRVEYTATNGSYPQIRCADPCVLDVWVFQLEEGESASSEIITHGAPVTRDRDQPQAALDSAAMASGVSLLASGRVYTSGTIAQIGDDSDRIRLRYDGTSIIAEVYSGGALQASHTLGAYTAGNFFRAAVAAGPDHLQCALDGTATTATTSGITYTAGDTLHIGTGETGGNANYGPDVLKPIYAIATQAQLEALTA